MRALVTISSMSDELNSSILRCPVLSLMEAFFLSRWAFADAWLVTRRPDPLELPLPPMLVCPVVGGWCAYCTRPGAGSGCGGVWRVTLPGCVFGFDVRWNSRMERGVGGVGLRRVWGAFSWGVQVLGRSVRRVGCFGWGMQAAGLSSCRWGGWIRRGGRRVALADPCRGGTGVFSQFPHTLAGENRVRRIGKRLGTLVAVVMVWIRVDRLRRALRQVQAVRLIASGNGAAGFWLLRGVLFSLE